MKVLLTGGRDFNDFELFCDIWNEFEETHGMITEVIHGGARGADRMADIVALYQINSEDYQDHPLKLTVCHADWTRHGKKAGPIRNSEMLALKPDWLIWMPGGNGTTDMLKKAEAAGVKIFCTEKHFNAFGQALVAYKQRK